MKRTTRGLIAVAASAVVVLPMAAYLGTVFAQAPATTPAPGPSPRYAKPVSPLSDTHFTPLIKGPYGQPTTEDFERDAQARDLLTRYNETEGQNDREKIVEDLTKIVSAQFDARQDSRELELKQLEEQVKKLRAMHERRAKEKEQIIKDRVRQLLRDAEGLGWGGEGAATGDFSGRISNYPAGAQYVRPADKK
jgi:hypothetical protein